MLRSVAAMALLAGCAFPYPPGCGDPYCRTNGYGLVPGPGFSLNDPRYFPDRPLYGYSQGPHAVLVPGGLYGDGSRPNSTCHEITYERVDGTRSWGVACQRPDGSWLRVR